MNLPAWFKVDIVDTRLTGKIDNGNAVCTLMVRTQIQWWRWSFVRFVRDHAEIEPSWLKWLTWPATFWLVAKFAWSQR